MSHSSITHVSQKNSRSKWTISFNAKKHERRELASPPGYSSEGHHSKEKSKEATSNDQILINKRGWDIALAPIKSLPMNVFLMYMAGNTISMFPIMMVGMMFFRPIQAMMGIKNTNAMLKSSDKHVLLTIVFILGNLIALGLATYKCHSMGLLPTHESDWLSFVTPLERVEFLAGGISH